MRGFKITTFVTMTVSLDVGILNVVWQRVALYLRSFPSFGPAFTGFHCAVSIGFMYIMVS